MLHGHEARAVFCQDAHGTHQSRFVSIRWCMAQGLAVALHRTAADLADHQLLCTAQLLLHVKVRVFDTHQLIGELLNFLLQLFDCRLTLSSRAVRQFWLLLCSSRSLEVAGLMSLLFVRMHMHTTTRCLPWE